MIEFNKISTTSNFIKCLLYNTYLPLLRTVRGEDYIIKDRYYIYKCNIIKCTNSGYLTIKNINLDETQFPKELLRKSDDVKVVNGQEYFRYNGRHLERVVGNASMTQNNPKVDGWFEKNIATYSIVDEYYFGKKNDKLCTNFLSSSEGYDYKTHETFGKYLRSLRDMYGLNLMPLYNCFSNTLLNNIHITNEGVYRDAHDYNTKVYKIPIRFNTDYTICMENIGKTTFAPAFIRHNTLLKLNNNRFGNSVDVTNKYIKLNNNSVISNEYNIKFKQPIKIRFNNVPTTRTVHYSDVTKTEIPAKFSSEYFTPDKEAGKPTYIKTYRENEEQPYRTVTYNKKVYSDYYEWVPVPNTHDGWYKFSSGTEEGSLFPANDLYPDDTLIPPTLEGDFYNSLNPSTGRFDDNMYSSFKQCSEDESLFNEYIFNSNKERYYIESDGEFTQCTSSTVYNPSTIYYYLNIDNNESWYEYNSETHELEKTSDTSIDLSKKYYKKYYTELDNSYEFDITEENCCMYDYVEDELYLLIQVPSSFNSNIVVLEGDYTDSSKEIYFNESKFQVFSEQRMDRLFTNNLSLMLSGTDKLVPFSDKLIQFLLWHAITGLDSINGNLDRLALNLDIIGASFIYYSNNYWTDTMRRTVFEYARDYPKFITDNLGYVTTDIEKILEIGTSYYNDVDATAEYRQAMNITEEYNGN